MNILGNPIENYVAAAIIIMIGLLIRAFGSRFIGRQFFRAFSRFAPDAHLQVFIGLLKKPIELFLLLFSLVLAFDRIHLPEDWWFMFGKKKYEVESILSYFGLVSLVVSITWIFLRSADFIAYVILHRDREDEDPGDKQLVRFLKDIIKVFIALFALFFILGAIYGMDVTSLVTGLGIGGLALALAAQETIANLIGSFVIFLDKPFQVGDLIESEKIKGVVESVGFRSTRIRTLDNNLLTVPNKKLVDSALNNLSKASFRRVRLEIPLSVETNPEDIRLVIKDIQHCISSHAMTSEDQLVVLNNMDENGYSVLVIYYVTTADVTLTSEVRHELNLQFADVLKRRKVLLAPIMTPRPNNKNPLV